MLSVKITGFDMKILMERGNQFFVILGMMVPPAFSYSAQVWKPLFDTIKMSLLGTVAGAVVVIPFAMAASTNIIKSAAIVGIMRLFLSIVRTLPTLVTALIATYVFGLGTWQELRP
uniref:PhnE/PtxC family ABC transporter permease n=1 Tax=Clostridium sp. NkU-1 TaxID=1095009 RepID=UPI000A9044B4